MAEKEFGKLSLEEIKLLLDQLRSLEALRREIQAGLAEGDHPFYTQLPLGYGWSNLYCLSYMQMLAGLVHHLGISPEIKKALKTDNPQGYLLSEMQNFGENIIPAEGTSLSGEQNIGAIIMATTRSLDSILIYGKSVNRLVLEVASGNIESLFKAVSIDHSVVQNPIVGTFLALGEVYEDQEFFKELGRVISKGPRKVPQDYGPLRYILATLSEMDCLDAMSQEALYQLFCVELKIYDQEGTMDDPARSLMKFIQRWRKDQATSNHDFMSSPSA